jgi:hypothetical protein
MRSPRLPTAAHRSQEVSFSIKEAPTASHKHIVPPRAVCSRNSGLTCEVSFSVDATVRVLRLSMETLCGRHRYGTLRQITNRQATATKYHTAPIMIGRHEVAFSVEKTHLLSQTNVLH